MSALRLRSAGRFFLAPLGLLCSFAVLAQNVPTVSFRFSFPGSEPEKYEIVVPLAGDASYSSNGKLNASADDNDFKLPIKLTDATRTRIFDLARKAGYFERELDSKKNVASTGQKTLIYNDGHKTASQNYNYSTNPTVQQLTELFQDLSATMEFGRRLDYYHRYQKLALDQELKRMEEMQKNNGLAEVFAIAPILNQILTDSTLINPVRARAQRILARAGIAPSP
ncbi:MAG TPA: hypothetical protein VFA68_12265 [Terriglobales bacterium]|nr:hypothetical protein [Terriglobales bacterium]